MPEVTESFDKLKVGNWLCPKKGYEVILKGKYASNESKQISIKIYPCKNTSFPLDSCASPGEITDYFLKKGDQMYFTFYFINVVINPNQANYVKYYLEDQSFIIFGSQIGTETYLYLSDYTISTDNSIWPYPNM